MLTLKINCLSVFDHFTGFLLEWLRNFVPGIIVLTDGPFSQVKKCANLWSGGICGETTNYDYSDD